MPNDKGDDERDSSGLRDPSTLFFQQSGIRRWIIASYWAVIILALPLWWTTTSIERLSLPSYALQEFSIPVGVSLDSAFDREGVSGYLRDKARGSGLDIRVGDDGEYRVVPGEEVGVEGRTLVWPPGKEGLGEMLEALLIPRKDHRVAEYSPRFRLAFTLLNEHSTTPSAWDVQPAISKWITPLTSALSVVHNFTIESQVQLYAPLAFEPVQLEDGTRGLTQEHLTVFINSAEWTLSSSSSNDPVLQFIQFIPSSPLSIIDSNANSFLIPQRAGIVIGSSTDDAFRTFASQLGTLLGLRSHASSWHLDTLLRQRTLQNLARTSDTLQSTVTLVSQIPGMPVTSQVRAYVQDAIAILRSPSQTLASSKDALVLANKAFFHPAMLALLYFPAEHKYAVYTPLFASAILPLFAAAVREVRDWRRGI